MGAGLLGISFVSGAAGLVDEVLWTRRLSLLFGSTALAQALVLAAFLGGLASGSARLGRAADRAGSALRFYARLEWRIAALGLLAPLFLRLCDGPVLRWLAPAAVLGQAFWMGGTLPALCRAAGGDAQGAVGRVYAANSAGAVLGALAAGFALIPVLGLDWAFAAAAALNAAAAAVAPRLGETKPAPARAAAPAGPELLPRDLVLATVFLSGVVALAYEVAWTRLLALVLGSSAYSFAEMLAAFIAGISLGSRLVSTGPLRRADPARSLALAELGAGAAVLAALPLCDRLPYEFFVLRGRFGSSLASFYAFEAAKFGVCLALTSVPTAFLGATVPLAVRLVERGADARGEGVGAVLAWNAAGNVLGAFAALAILPALGVEGILRSGTTIHLAAGAGLLLWRAPPTTARRRALVLAGLAAFAAARARLPRWDHVALNQGMFRGRGKVELKSFAEFRSLFADDRMPFRRDDREATVVVMRYANGELALKVNGKTDASSSADMNTQIVLGELPLLLRPGARRALVVGWGSGVTAGSVLRHPVEGLDAVELIPAVVAASRAFAGVNGRALEDPRLRLTVEDAKTFLARPGPVYDVIVSEPSNPWMAGVGDLFSTEFYARARARLAPGGLMVQWFHAYEMDDALLREVLRTFGGVFPRLALWDLGDADAILVGSDAPIRPDFAAMEEAFARPGVRADLSRAGATFPTTLLALQSAATESVREIAGPGRANSEIRPDLEYGAPVAFFRGDKAFALRARDDRMDPARGKDLVLAEYLAARGRPLERHEIMDWVAYPHTDLDEPMIRRVVADWKKRFPRDKTADFVARKLDELDRERAAAKR